MEFKKYQHIERLGTTETDGIEFGSCHVFPKIDGTNGSAWLADGGIRFGSRKRELTEDFDNSGFLAENKFDDRIAKFLIKYPDLRLFGEWLVPHSLKTYRQEAWRKFYVFDVTRDLVEEQPSGEKFEYLTYDEYKPMLEEFDIDYIPCIAIIRNGNEDMFYQQLPNNNFLVEDGKGAGEGLVIKNYDYKNRYGRTTWAKIVTSKFKEKHCKEMGATVKPVTVTASDKIVDEYCTEALIEKTYAKIVAECGGWSSNLIPRLFGTIYHDLVSEECWNFVKKYKNPVVDFNRMYKLVIIKVKETKPELF